MPCSPLANVFVCGGIHVFRWFVSMFVPLEGAALNILSLFASSVLIYVLAKLLGRIGGVILMTVGGLGAVFTGGASLVLSVLGFLLTVFSKAAILIVLLNVGLYALCISLGCV